MRPWFCPVVLSSHRRHDPVAPQRLFAIPAIPVVPPLTVPLRPISSSAVQSSDGSPLYRQKRARGEDRQSN